MSQSTLATIKNISNSFPTKYLTLCKGKNVLPNHDITKNKLKLEIVADRLKICEWQMISKALEHDNTLQSIEIVSRRAVQCVREQIDTDKRCRAVIAKGDPIISTKFIFCPLIRSISNCVKLSTEIQSLALEGLPLTVVYIQSIANAILQNNSLRMLSFARSNLMDDGCVIICSTIKHLSHIEKLNFSYCDLTEQSARPISDLIKFQTINRYSEEWKRSFRYQDVTGAPPGLKCLLLNGNVELGDKGLRRIAMDLKDDEWIKAIEFQNCGLTDAGGLSTIDCLKCNKSLTIFDVSYNPKMSKRIFNEIQKMLGADPDTLEPDRKESTMNLRETIELLEQRLEIESMNCEQANKMNIQLHNKLKAAKDVQNKREVDVPSGYLLINEKVLKDLQKKLVDLRQATVQDCHPLIETKHQVSEQSVFGDSTQLENVQLYQELSRRIQHEYPEVVTDAVDSSSQKSSERTQQEDTIQTDNVETANVFCQDQSISEDETTSLLRVNKGKMKSVYTMLSDPMSNPRSDETTDSDQN